MKEGRTISIILPTMIFSLAAYVVVRFGVKHGMRAYYAEERRNSGN